MGLGIDIEASVGAEFGVVLRVVALVVETTRPWATALARPSATLPLVSSWRSAWETIRSTLA